MRQHVKHVMMSMGLSLVVWAVSVTAPAWAGVDVDINIVVPLPPAIVVDVQPAMVFLDEPSVYVAIGVPYDLFFIDGRYYYVHGGYWYWAAGYGGPWVHVVYRSLPPGLRKFKVEKLHQFREREFKLYTLHGPKYRGKHFKAIPGPGHKVRKEMKERSMEKNGPMKPGKGRNK